MSRNTIAGVIVTAILALIFVLHFTGIFPMHTY